MQARRLDPGGRSLSALDGCLDAAHARHASHAPHRRLQFGVGVQEAREVALACLQVLHLLANDFVHHLRGHLEALGDLLGRPLHPVVEAIAQGEHLGMLRLPPLLHLAHRVAKLLFHDGVLRVPDAVATALDAVRRHLVLPRLADPLVVPPVRHEGEHRAAREALQSALNARLGPIEELGERDARRPPPVVLHGQVRRRLSDLLHVVLQRLRQSEHVRLIPQRVQHVCADVPARVGREPDLARGVEELDGPKKSQTALLPHVRAFQGSARLVLVELLVY
mmetsp:Transcript_20052/g.59228  ORF Transcript_20052/g.59228 Transcript_20052/m.59228 type:complete len:279 (-) Transcript_20052:635-1471(-)